MPIKVCREYQACALVAEMFSATAAGIYNEVEDAQKAMNSGFAIEYQPNPEHTAKYAELYKEYQKFGAFTEANV